MTDHYDIVVVGGGIHGVGVAQAAACYGYSVLLLEQTALAAGSSSRSSKLIHGGLRYLEGYDFGLVRESLVERAILLQIAPDLVHLQPFHIPIYPETSRRPFAIRAGLTLYALLGGLDRASRFKKITRNQWDRLDGLDTNRLQAVYQYHDAQTNDAGLTRAVMQSAIDLGAHLCCPSEFLAATIGKQGVDLLYRDNAVEKSCTAAVLVNAGGPWVNTIAARISPQPAGIDVELVQGTHLVLEGGLTAGCYYMEAPQDRRAVFLLPWGEYSMLGTTENVYDGNPARVSPLAEEEDYLLAVMARYFPERPLYIVDRFAGLRVLPASGSAAFKRSRETHLSVDNTAGPRTVAIYGGKLTGYRATAEKVIKILRRTLPERKPRAKTAKQPLRPV
ncbi:MAG: FAD-dependent oxidoreductase [Gammaproteobacteria bacterium]|nr:FAD-dependent oxidoreductase [Gammaproteobacteria bacterium]